MARKRTFIVGWALAAIFGTICINALAREPSPRQQLLRSIPPDFELKIGEDVIWKVIADERRGPLELIAVTEDYSMMQYLVIGPKPVALIEFGYRPNWQLVILTQGSFDDKGKLTYTIPSGISSTDAQEFAERIKRSITEKLQELNILEDRDLAALIKRGFGPRTSL